MLRPLFVSFASLTLATGVAYPCLTAWAARAVFPFQAGGSLLRSQGVVRGSLLIGQSTEDPRYFWGRPSVTAGFPTNASRSGGSTLSPSNPALKESVARRIQALQSLDPKNPAPIPQDLVAASGSGLDPHISLEAARYQIPRIARLRRVQEDTLRLMVAQHLEIRPLRVNVLLLNQALDGTQSGY